MARSQSVMPDACMCRILMKPVSDIVDYPLNCNLRAPASYLLGSMDDRTALGWLVAPSGHTPAPKGPAGKSGHGTTFEASRLKVRTKSSKTVRTWMARFRAPIGRPLIGTFRGPLQRRTRSIIPLSPYRSEGLVYVVSYNPCYRQIHTTRDRR